MRKSVAFGVVVLVVLAIAAGAAYALWARAEGVQGQDVAQQPPGGENGQKEEGEGGQQQAACVPGKPEPVRYSLTGAYPSAKLGEWVDIKDKEGRTVLRARVTMEQVVPSGSGGDRDGSVSVSVLARLRMDVENLACEPFEWDLQSENGLALGVFPPIEGATDPGLRTGFIDSSTFDMKRSDHGIFVAKDGKFVTFNQGDVPQLRNYPEGLMKYYGWRALEEFPDKFPPGKTSGEFFILVDAVDQVRGRDGDGNLPLILGGAKGFARINLGSAKSWYDQFVKPVAGVESTDRKWRDVAFADQVTQRIVNGK